MERGGKGQFCRGEELYQCRKKPLNIKLKNKRRSYSNTRRVKESVTEDLILPNEEAFLMTLRQASCSSGRKEGS